MKVLDLGCRTGSAVAAWQSRGHTVVGVDWEDHGQQIQGDFTKYETWEIIDNAYDFIWFSPDCSIFSIANQHSNHFCPKTYRPKTKRAFREVEGIKFVLDRIKERAPRLGWVMENPRALMRKMDFTQDLHRATVTYCQYGDERMKPTDLFGQLPYSFVPKACRNGDSCHIPAPRGSRTGTQGMSKTEAGRIPFALSLEIMLSAIESGGKSIPTLKEWI